MSELRLNTDGHIIKFGADNDVSLTHVADTGLLLNSTRQLQFNDASQNINAPSATVLDINATDEIELNATLVDINANVEISGTATTTGVHTFSAAPVFPDGSIAVADLDIDGATDIGAAVVDADLFIIDDGAGGTNRKVTASRLKTYAGGAATIGALTDVTMDATNFVDSILIQTESDGSAPSTGTLSSASRNIGIGKQVFAALTSGAENVAIGPECGKAITSGSNNILIGTSAGDTLTTGSKNLIMGVDAGGAITTGDDNVLMGRGTGGAITTGSTNIFIGYGAGDGHDEEQDNLGIGKDALGGPIAGAQYNTGVGAIGVGAAMTSGDWNSGFGSNTLEAITTGNKNTFLGANAGATVTTGSENTMIGYAVDASATGSTHQIGLGHNLTVSANDQFRFGNGGTDVVYNQFATNASWTRASDERIKKDIKTNEDCGLDFINDLRTVTFKKRAPSELPEHFRDYDENKKQPKHKEKLYGMIAQEVKASLDKYDITDFGGWHEDEKSGQQGLSQEMFIYPLIKAIQELTTRVKELEAK